MKTIFKIILATIVILLLCPGVLQAAVIIDDQYLKWEVLERQQAEEITGEDEACLYIRLNGSPAKIKKELNSVPELLKSGEECDPENVKDKQLAEVDQKLLRIKDHTLYYRDVPVMDMTKYIEENDGFYKENSAYSRSDISFYAYEYNLDKGGIILQVITIVDGSVPAPYTPSHSDTFWLSGSTVRRIGLASDFRLTSVWENTDGSWGLAGWLKAGKSRRENSLFLVGSDLKVFSLNAALQKNDIEVLGREKDSLLVRAITRTVSSYILPDQDKYRESGGGIYSVGLDYSITRRPENIKDCKSIYLDQQGFIYALSTDGQEIKNLTSGKSYRLAEAVTAFDRENQRLEGLDFKYGVTPTRLDRDGSEWYVQDLRIIHRHQGKKMVFTKGLPVLMYPVENLFIDDEGGKWFLGPAGIAYYSDDLTSALNMNPYLGGGISLRQTENLYVDGQKRVWFFGEEITCVPFQKGTITAPESALLQGFTHVTHEYCELTYELSSEDFNGFTHVTHEYCESGGQGIFIYQKENSADSYTIRVLTINKEGIVGRQDLTLDKKVLRYFVYDEQIHLVLPDGLLILDEGRNVTVRNPELLQDLDFRYRDDDCLIFTGRYRIVIIHLPKPGDTVDPFVRMSAPVNVNGKNLPVY
ncbi:MAG: hypothetical protein ACOWWO_08675 [Peptococcaceae bacterium]